MSSERTDGSPFRALLEYRNGDDRFDHVFDLLKDRITFVARKRVPDNAVQDIAQNTLLILLNKLASLGSECDVLPYTFQILRQVIGNYYQEEEKASRSFTPLESQELVKIMCMCFRLKYTRFVDIGHYQREVFFPEVITGIEF